MTDDERAIDAVADSHAEYPADRDRVVALARECLRLRAVIHKMATTRTADRPFVGRPCGNEDAGFVFIGDRTFSVYATAAEALLAWGEAQRAGETQG